MHLDTRAETKPASATATAQGREPHAKPSTRSYWEARRRAEHFYQHVKRRLSGGAAVLAVLIVGDVVFGVGFAFTYPDPEPSLAEAIEHSPSVVLLTDQPYTSAFVVVRADSSSSSQLLYNLAFTALHKRGEIRWTLILSAGGTDYLTRTQSLGRSVSMKRISTGRSQSAATACIGSHTFDAISGTSNATQDQVAANEYSYNHPQSLYFVNQGINLSISVSVPFERHQGEFVKSSLPSLLGATTVNCNNFTVPSLGTTRWFLPTADTIGYAYTPKTAINSSLETNPTPKAINPPQIHWYSDRSINPGFVLDDTTKAAQEKNSEDVGVTLEALGASIAFAPVLDLAKLKRLTSTRSTTPTPQNTSTQERHPQHQDHEDRG